SVLLGVQGSQWTPGLLSEPANVCNRGTELPGGLRQALARLSCEDPRYRHTALAQQLRCSHEDVGAFPRRSFRPGIERFLSRICRTLSFINVPPTYGAKYVTRTRREDLTSFFES